MSTAYPGTSPLVVTAGEPAGIGPDLCIALARSRWAADIVILGDRRNLAARAAQLGEPFDLPDYEAPEGLNFRGRGGSLLHLPLPQPGVCGQPAPANAEALLAGLRRAVEGCRRGEFAALVTGPLHKSVINDAGIPFTGHTEFLAGLLKADMPVMLLVAGNLRVALATTHLPLRAVADSLGEERLSRVIEVLHGGLADAFGIEKPVIRVCGLNPHAGEGGHLGHEEEQVIGPVLARLRRRGFDLRGPMPADTAFIGAAEQADAVLAMYHDQGLPVLKYAGFGHAVNVTLGLPVLRTSVDHGTALDIAGSGRADPGSMIAAIELAADLAGRAAARQ